MSQDSITDRSADDPEEENDEEPRFGQQDAGEKQSEDGSAERPECCTPDLHS